MAAPVDRTLEVEALEVRLLTEAVYAHSGFDFREYAGASLRRRIASRLEPEGVRSISQLQDRVLHDPASLERLVAALTVHVTSMFRDPGFYRAFRDRVVPVLAAHPFVRLWIAGCSTGEEVYSVAILLQEAGLLDRCRVYATDLCETTVQRARAGIYPLDAVRQYTTNYHDVGGREEFSAYYTASDGDAIMRPSLRDRVVFAQHSLATDTVFNQFQVVLCRNVMIYFDRGLQDRVHRLLYDSLEPSGTLGLGTRESLRFTPHEDAYEPLDAGVRLYKKCR